MLTAGWRREDRLALGGLVVLVFGSLPFLVHPWYDPVQDGSLYLAGARSIVAGDGYSLFGYVFSLRPPGFSYLLAPWIAVFGTDFSVLNAWISVWGAVGVLLLFVYQRDALGGPLAACVSLMIWLNPLYQKLCNQPMSDIPGITFLIGCLLVERWSRRSRSPHSELVLGIAIGLAAYARSLNVLLIPAILISRVWGRLTGECPDGDSWMAFALKRLLVVSVATWLVLLPWNLHKKGRIAPPPADQVFAYDYSTGMLHRDAGDPSSPRLEIWKILGRSDVRSRQLASVIGSRLREHVEGNQEPQDERLFVHEIITTALIALLCVALLKRKMPAEFFCLGALVCILFYFGFRERLTLPIFTLMVPCAIGVLRDGLAKLRRGHVATAATCSIILLLTAVDTSFHQDWTKIENRHMRNIERFKALETALGADARIGVLGDQKVISVYLEREVPTTRIALRRANDLEAIEEIVDKYNLNTIVSLKNTANTTMMNRVASRSDRAVSRFLTERYGRETEVGTARFWRVRPE